MLDPIDGTRAFLTGRPLFGTLIALLHRGVPVLGLIDQPVTGERWIGIAGPPTRFRSPIGGTPRCRPCAAHGGGGAVLHRARHVRARRRAAASSGCAGAARRVTWGGDCYAYGLLALGLVDVVAESDHEALGLGGAGAGDRGRRRPRHRLGRASR